MDLGIFKKVLRRLAMLATAARSTTGTVIRPVIVGLVFGIASMSDILEFKEYCHPQLQWMTIEILKNLTLDDESLQAVGSTARVIRNLFTLYSYSRNLDWSGVLLASEKNKKAEKAMSERAGDALNLLVTMSSKHCLRMVDLHDGNGKKTFIETLICLLNEYREQTICAAKILRSLMEYESYSQNREIAARVVRVMILVMGSSSNQLRMHEALVGLAPGVLAVLDEPTYRHAFEKVDPTQLVPKLFRNLEYKAQADNSVPRIPRHSIELMLASMVDKDHRFFAEFMRQGLLEEMLRQTLDTICDIEDFVICSGAGGRKRFSVTMEDFVKQSLVEVRILGQERGAEPFEALLWTISPELPYIV